MATETDDRAWIVRKLSHRHAIPVENPAKPGTPDVNYDGGWIEMKHLKAWPKRPTTAIKIPTYTSQQRVFARRRDACGGKIFFLLVVGYEWALMDGLWAADNIGTATQAEIRRNTIYLWDQKPTRKELDEWL